MNESEKFKLDQELKDLAIDWAEKIYNNMYRALTDPVQGMTPDTVKLYNDLRSWGWFDIVNIDDDDAHQILIKLIAMPRYRQLLEHKKNPPISKWQKVAGRGITSK